VFFAGKYGCEFEEPSHLCSFGHIGLLDLLAAAAPSYVQ